MVGYSLIPVDDLHKFRYAPGDYFNHCWDCKSEFIGDKRAHRCKSCAETLWIEEQIVAAAVTWRKCQLERNKIGRTDTICRKFKELTNEDWHNNVNLKTLVDEYIERNET